MTTKSETKVLGMLAAGALAGGLLSSCGTANLGGSNTPSDPVAASIRTHQEFEQYWGARRTVTPEPTAEVESSAPSYSAPVADSYVAEETPAEPVLVEEEPVETWVVEEPVNGSRPSKKDALPVTTWWEYQGDTGRGARDYTNLGAGAFPTGKKVFGSSKYVISPYHGGYVKVGNVPRGALVADPNYDLAERKYFILP